MVEEHEAHLRKQSHFFLILITISSLFCPSTTAASSAVKDDASVMTKLSKSLTPAPFGWSGSDPCLWTGVSCDSFGHVTSISLASKSLTGELPSELNRLFHLKSLSLQRNQLSGSLPALSNLPSLQQAYLDNNNFTSIPFPFLAGLTSLQTLSLSENPNLPPWTLPETLSDSTTLTTLYAGNANLIGSLPDIFASFPSLQNVRLSYNNLTGPLPPSFAKSGIQNLWINNQDLGLSGRIDVIGSMPQLSQVWLHQNQFSGPIPDLSQSTSLFDLSLRDNELTGLVPVSLTTLPKLVNVSLQNNKFQGPQPSFPSTVRVSLGDTNNFCNPKPGPCDPQVTTLLAIARGLGYPMSLAESWSGNNPCDGWKSVSCDSKGSVTVLNLGKQGWIGIISLAIANLTGLTTLLLNDNNLTGSIPPELTKLVNLRLLDVSNNNISGEVPAFGSGVTVKISGNPFLVGKIPPTGNETSPGSSPSNSNSPSTSSSSGNIDSSSGGTETGVVEKGKLSISPWVIVASIIVAVIAMLALSLVFYKRVVGKLSGKYPWSKKETKKNGPSGSEMPSQCSAENTDIQVHDGGNVTIPIEVLREVTDNFSDNNILGRGGFGIVYRGQLHDGTQIAVKRMEAMVSSSKGLSEFQAEIAVLSKVRHRHLVALHGFCINGNERLLVYEYMPGGTLGRHLFSYRELELSPLTWKQRVTIALDVAKGVEYLHGLAQQSFIHRDLKPSNILLGDDMRAKVSDFGLVKNTPDGKYSVETRLAGTFGYLAPEYAATGRVTTKVDVFAFGVVLMEIITARKALDESLPDENSHLVTWFRRVLNNKDNIKKSLDSTLDPDEETFESICKVTELAGHCTAREPFQRPDMGHVVTVLSPLVGQWKPSTQEGEEESFGIGYGMSLPQAIQIWQSGEGTTVIPSNYHYGYSTPANKPEGTSGAVLGPTDGRSLEMEM